MILSNKKISKIRPVRGFWDKGGEKVKWGKCKTEEMGGVIVFVLYINSFWILESKLVLDSKIRRALLKGKKKWHMRTS